MSTPQTRRVEAKNVPVDVYNAMRSVLRYTGESQSSFIARAIRAEVEKRAFEMQKKLATESTVRAREERIRKLSRRVGSREARRRIDAQVQGEITTQIKVATQRSAKEAK